MSCLKVVFTLSFISHVCILSISFTEYIAQAAFKALVKMVVPVHRTKASVEKGKSSASNTKKTPILNNLLFTVKVIICALHTL